MRNELAIHPLTQAERAEGARLDAEHQAQLEAAQEARGRPPVGYNGLIATTGPDGVEVREQFSRGHAKATAPFGAPNGILDSARTTAGVPIPPNKLEAGSVVSVPGYGEMQVRSAVECGFLRYDAAGNLVETGAALPSDGGTDQQNGVQQRQQDQSEDGEEQPQEGPLRDALIAAEDAHGADTFNAVTLAYANHEAVPEEYQQVAEEVAAGLVEQATQQVDAAIAPLGITSEDLRGYAAANPEEFRDAVVKLTTMNSVGGFKAMAENHIAALPSEAVMEMQRGPGVELQRTSDGTW